MISREKKIKVYKVLRQLIRDENVLDFMEASLVDWDKKLNKQKMLLYGDKKLISKKKNLSKLACFKEILLMP